jgi:hypothetical protein
VPIEDEVLCYEPRVDVLTCAGYAYFTTVSLIEADPEYAANLTTERHHRVRAPQSLALRGASGLRGGQDESVTVTVLPL